MGPEDPSRLVTAVQTINPDEEPPIPRKKVAKMRKMKKA